MVRTAEKAKTPVMCVVGDKERDDGETNHWNGIHCNAWASSSIDLLIRDAAQAAGPQLIYSPT
jgi:hypothetical protein